MNTINQLEKRRKQIIKRVPPLKRILRSTISKYYLTCGYAKCRCRKGEKHGPFIYLSAKERDKVKMCFVPKEIAKEVEEGVKNYHKLWDKICQLCQMNREILWLKKRW